MAKTLKITFEDKEYTLGYSRRTIAALEDQGLDISEVEGKPMSDMLLFITGAFKLHHNYMTQDQIVEIIKNLEDKDGFVGALIELYKEAIDSIYGEPKKSSKNAKWSFK